MNISFEIYFNSLSKTCFANVFLLLGCHNANFGPLIMRQPFSLDFNHMLCCEIDLKVTGSLVTS